MVKTETSPSMSGNKRSPLLDASQSEFCEIGNENVRLLAPAGSGKTLSLLHRCKTLAELAKEKKPKFLVFTFTRAARDELRDRLRSNPSFAEIAPLVTITTLNAWGFKQLKSEYPRLKLLSDKKDRYFTIQNMLRPVWMNHEPIKVLLDDSRKSSRYGEVLWDLIDLMKSMGFRHDTLASFNNCMKQVNFLADCGMHNQLDGLLKHLYDLEIIKDKADWRQVYENFVPFWKEVCEQLGRSATFTLDDQKYWPRIMIEEQLKKKAFITGAPRYNYVFVDEFQDINPLDLALLKAIVGINKALVTIVGDDDQAIYEWRGATPDFILDPDKYLNGHFLSHILSTNYRSPLNIVKISQNLILHNSRRVKKEVKAACSDKAQITVHRFSSVGVAISSTAELVSELLRKGDCENIALISRKRSQLIPYQIIFAGKNMPFYAAEDLQVLLSHAFTEMKDMLVVHAKSATGNFFSNDAVADILKLCDKVKRYPLSKQDREDLRRYLYTEQPTDLQAATLALGRYPGKIKTITGGGYVFADAIARLISAKSVSESIRAVSEHFEGLQKDYGKSIEDIFYTDPPFLYLAEFAERYGNDFSTFYKDIEKAIATLARVPPADEEPDDNAEWKRSLHLMTALRAKGKEFDTVIVLDANAGVWPNKLATTENDLEQERRLFYVAITRARRQLHFVVNDSILSESVNPAPYFAEMGLPIPVTAIK
ncbi:MAG: ATP-dependent helicase [Lentisphaerae bacterium]|nr:ATP-dependent helicase [Lentisphaerota bacterium]